MGTSSSKPAQAAPKKEWVSCSFRNTQSECVDQSLKPNDCYWNGGCYTKGGVGHLSTPNGRADTLDEGLLETVNENRWDQDE